ncbi:uncharacterized protein KY384_006874 [Bacidia gigantensis]|uniref:uncharacterized protein n=1 Tax=Bacidia gigantensis TaxID=2732470 RepID=UPI001D056CCA|nr:uncharacterized protein KY384_006874 [Bacidia gigantensis]KAG8527958.1 hypothetical protein KY384_006874 [Bacidia gigantensis]
MLTPPAVSHLHPGQSRKRKAEDDDPIDIRMTPSPRLHTLPLASHQRPSPKRSRTEPLGRPLSFTRILETLDANALRGALQEICMRHPTLKQEIEATSPRPSVASALSVLKTYETALSDSFPFGGDHTSDYAYNRVRPALMQLLDALADFVPHFLPPNETQASTSLQFLDGATEVIHRLPVWQSFQNNLHKQEAYEEVSHAWVVAIREAGKRAGGMQLKYEGWEQRINKHNATSAGRLQEAVDELSRVSGWIGTGQPQGSGERSNVRQELLSGNYGSNVSVRVGPW